SFVVHWATRSRVPHWGQRNAVICFFSDLFRTASIPNPSGVVLAGPGCQFATPLPSSPWSTTKPRSITAGQRRQLRGLDSMAVLTEIRPLVHAEAGREARRSTSFSKDPRDSARGLGDQ